MHCEAMTVQDRTPNPESRGSTSGNSSGSFTSFARGGQLGQKGMAGVQVIALQRQGIGQVRDERGSDLVHFSGQSLM